MSLHFENLIAGSWLLLGVKGKTNINSYHLSVCKHT